MRVDWTTVDANASAQQPVNTAVLIAAAQQIVARASAAALMTNRLAFYDDAVRMLREAAGKLREMGKGIPEIEAIAAALDGEVAVHAVATEPMAMKARHFASYSISHARDSEGKARRNTSGPSH